MKKKGSRQEGYSVAGAPNFIVVQLVVVRKNA
jgi:hypothetical protein